MSPKNTLILYGFRKLPVSANRAELIKIKKKTSNDAVIKLSVINEVLIWQILCLNSRSFSTGKGSKLSGNYKTFYAKQTYFQKMFFLKKLCSVVLIYTSPNIIFCSYVIFNLIFQFLSFWLLCWNIFFVENLHCSWYMCHSVLHFHRIFSFAHT